MTQQLQLLPHQELVKNFFVQNPYAGAFLPMGTGKTLTTLAALQEIQPTGHILVIAPLNIARSVWIDEIEKWGINVNYFSLITNDKGKKLSRKERYARYDQILNETQQAKLCFINKDLLKDLVEYVPYWPFPTVVIDESQSFKNPTSQRFKVFKAIMPYISRLYLLTGTPIPNGMEDLWSQIYMLDGGETLGKNITTYRNRYFSCRELNSRVRIYEFIESYRQPIFDSIKHLVLHTENTSIKLPDISYETQYVHLDEDEKSLYFELANNDVLNLMPEDIRQQYSLLVESYNKALDEIDLCVKTTNFDKLESFTIEANMIKSQMDEIAYLYTSDMDSAVVLRNKLLQYASGMCYLEDKLDENGDPIQTIDDSHLLSTNLNRKLKLIHSKKLEMLPYLIDLDPDPVLIAYRFKADAIRIADYLKSKKYKVSSFDGSPQMIHDWNNGKIPVMLIQPASAGHGLNLQDGGHTLIWYTLPDSLEQYQQCNARLHRMGQTKPVTIYQLLTKDTIDEAMPNLLENKALTQQALLNAVHRNPVFKH